MKIRSKIERKGGTRVTMDADNYHFQPRVEGGPHIDTVSNKDHAARFLAIREGFEIAEADEERSVLLEPVAPQTSMQTSATAMQAAQGIVAAELLGEARTGAGQVPADETAADETEDEDTGGEPLEHPMDAAAGTGEAEPQAKEAPEQPEQPDEGENTRELTDDEFSVLSQVLTEADKSSDEQVAAAFKVLAGREPNARAKRETIIAKTREMAVEQGFLEA